MTLSDTTVLTLLLERGDRESLARVERAFTLAKGDLEKAAAELGASSRTLKRWLHGNAEREKGPIAAVVKIARAHGWEPGPTGEAWHAVRRAARIRRAKREALRRRGGAQ